MLLCFYISLYIYIFLNNLSKNYAVCLLIFLYIGIRIASFFFSGIISYILIFSIIVSKICKQFYTSFLLLSVYFFYFFLVFLLFFSFLYSCIFVVYLRICQDAILIFALLSSLFAFGWYLVILYSRCEINFFLFLIGFLYFGFSYILFFILRTFFIYFLII